MQCCISYGHQVLCGTQVCNHMACAFIFRLHTHLHPCGIPPCIQALYPAASPMACLLHSGAISICTLMAHQFASMRLAHLHSHASCPTSTHAMCSPAPVQHVPSAHLQKCSPASKPHDPSASILSLPNRSIHRSLPGLWLCRGACTALSPVSITQCRI